MFFDGSVGFDEHSSDENRGECPVPLLFGKMERRSPEILLIEKKILGKGLDVYWGLRGQTKFPITIVSGPLIGVRSVVLRRVRHLRAERSATTHGNQQEPAERAYGEMDASSAWRGTRADEADVRNGNMVGDRLIFSIERSPEGK